MSQDLNNDNSRSLAAFKALLIRQSRGIASLVRSSIGSGDRSAPRKTGLNNALVVLRNTPAPRKIRWLRRLSQTIFLVLFLLATLHFGRLATPLIGKSWPASVLRLFFQIDPLAALLGALGGRSLTAGFWWLLPVLLGAILVGRFFCGWICPLGTLNQLFSLLSFGKKRGKVAQQRNLYNPWQATKYYLLTAGLIAALFGSALLGWFDPLAILQRGVGFALLPATHYAADSVVRSAAAAANPAAARGIHILWAQSSLGAQRAIYTQGLGLALLLVAVLLANLFITRFWCRFICPLGALLGAVSGLSPLKLKQDKELCHKCGQCMIHCQGGDQPKVGLPWHKQECHLCLNCVSVCPNKSITFTLKPKPAGDGAPTDINRRLLAGSVGVGLVALPILHSAPSFASSANPLLIRPPGATEEDNFLARCVRCGNCIKACPNNALQPSLFEGGLESLWTPVLVPHIGFCAPNCTFCSEVCPTGAIGKLSVQDKGWIQLAPKQNPVRLGTAFYDHGRCLPWANGVECGFCEKACPVTPKAIYFEEAEVTKRTGETVKIKRPVIDLSRCVGCGACERFCVLHDHPAVELSRSGESRERKDRLIVNGLDLTKQT